jgi:hypothetical protein
VVDLYGMAGFDVLCVTDHVLRGDYRWPLRHERPCVDTTNVGAYLAEIERERASARSAYGLLLVPGFELTYNHPNPERAGHAVAVGCTASSRWTTGRPRRWSRRAPRAPRFSPRTRTTPVDAGRPVPHVLLRAALAGAARALRSRGALQRAAAVQLGRGGRTAGPSPAATCTGPNSFPAGRRSSPANRTSGRSSTTCARTGRCS